MYTPDAIGIPGICDHDLGYGAYCIYQCGHLFSPADYLAYMGEGEEINRSWYESYWPGPREASVYADH